MVPLIGHNGVYTILLEATDDNSVNDPDGTKSCSLPFTLTVYSTNICPTFNFNLDGQEIELNAYTIFQPDFSVVDTDDASGELSVTIDGEECSTEDDRCEYVTSSSISFDTEGYNGSF